MNSIPPPYPFFYTLSTHPPFDPVLDRSRLVNRPFFPYDLTAPERSTFVLSLTWLRSFLADTYIRRGEVFSHSKFVWFLPYSFSPPQSRKPLSKRFPTSSFWPFLPPNFFPSYPPRFSIPLSNVIGSVFPFSFGQYKPLPEYWCSSGSDLVLQVSKSQSSFSYSPHIGGRPSYSYFLKTIVLVLF